MSKVLLNLGYYSQFDIGKPVSGGSLYVGVVDTDPEVVLNQKTITALQEDGSEVSLSQPVSLSSGGYPVYNGSPVSLFVDGPYSIKILSSLGVQEYYIPKNDIETSETQSVDTIADLAAEPFEDGALRIVKGRSSYDDDAGGNFIFDSADLSTEVTNDPQKGIYVSPNSDLTGASGAWVRQSKDYINVRDFGAKGNLTDYDSDAINSAIQTAVYLGIKNILAPDGDYLLDSSVLLNATSINFYGPSRGSATLYADFQGGAVIKVTEARCHISNLSINSTGDRLSASPSGKTAPDATVDGLSLDRGILFENSGSNPLTYSKVSKVDIVNQPADGIAYHGDGSGFILEQVGIAYCGGHGIFLGDGDRDGTDRGRCGIGDINDCIIQQCWGHGLAMGVGESNTVYRIGVRNLDIFTSCLGDGGTNQPSFLTPTPGTVAIRGENVVLRQCGIAGEKGYGVTFSVSTGCEINSTRFLSSLTAAVLFQTGCHGLRVTNPYFAPEPPIGFSITSGCTGVNINDVISSQFTSSDDILDTGSPVSIVVDGVRAKNIIGSTELFLLEGLQTWTIVVGGTVNVEGSKVYVIGQGDLTDTISVFRFDTGVDLGDGDTFTIFNFNAYNLNIAETGNINTQGTTAVLESGESLSFVQYDGTYYAMGREIP